MKRYENSIISYRCTGCGTTIYNATKEFKKCSECGYKLIKVDKPVKEINYESKICRSN